MSDYSFDQLAQMRPKDLEAVFAAGVTPQIDSLAGWRFRGFNVLLPLAKPIMKPLGFMRFAKAFYQLDGEAPPSAGGGLRGFNFKIRPGGLHDPWQASPSEESPARHGFYNVYGAGQGKRWHDKYDHALYLDYGERADVNKLLDGGALFGDGGIRDYVVQVSAGDQDLLLGKAYYRLPPLTVEAGFFILQRDQEHDFGEPDA